MNDLLKRVSENMPSGWELTFPAEDRAFLCKCGWIPYEFHEFNIYHKSELSLAPLTALLKQSLESRFTMHMSWLHDDYAEIQLHEPGAMDSFYHVGGDKIGDFTLIAEAYLASRESK